MKRQPVGDRDDAGNYQLSWLWICDECGYKEIDRAGTRPEGWDVDDEDDLLNCRVVCPECVEHGLEA